MSMEKFKYMLSANNLYIVPFTDDDGKEFSAEIYGRDIIAQIEKSYKLEKSLRKDPNEALDKEQEVL
jgi:phage terminase large subunit GpA-like protein